MDAIQYNKLQILSRLTYQPGSYDKRFTRDVAGLAKDKPLTEKQAHYLEILWHKYRRQIANHQRWCKVCSGEIQVEKKPRGNPADDRARLQQWKESVAQTSSNPVVDIGQPGQLSLLDFQGESIIDSPLGERDGDNNARG